MNTKRIFIGAFIRSDKLYRFFNEIKTDFNLTGNLRWTASPSNLHITFIFLGDTSEKDISKINEILHPYINRKINTELELTGLSFFSRNGKPSVLYVKTKDLTGNLSIIQKQITETLQQNGIIKNIEQRFVPHITLARIKNVNKSFYEKVKDYEDFFIDRYCDVKPEITESILKPTGAVYKPLIF